MLRPALSAFAVCAAACLACTTTSAGPPVTETRATGDFRAIELAGALSLDVQVGGATHVEVTAESGAIKRVTTEVHDGRLVIETHGNFHGRTHVAVTLPALDAFALSGAGSITVHGIASPQLTVDVHGAGSVELAGTADRVDYQVEGASAIHAKDLAAKTATVTMGGTGSLSLTATDQLTVSVSGVGSVDVFGHPKSVTKSISGVGTIDIH